MSAKIFYVGQPNEVAHHAAPLQSHLPISIADTDVVAQTASAGDVAIFYSEHFDRFRTLCMTLKARGVATLYAIDGILEWRNAWENKVDELACPWTMRPCLSHIVATIGPRQTAILNSWGNARQTITIGLPRLDPLATSFLQSLDDTNETFGKGTTSATTVGQHKPENLSASVCSQSTFRILVMTAKCPGFTPQQIETTRLSLAAIQAQLQSTIVEGKSVEIVWRLSGDLPEQLGVVNAGTAGQSSQLPDLLCNVDAVITTASTAILEAMLVDRPVAILDFHNTIAYTDAAFRISHASQILPIVQQMTHWDKHSAKRQMQHYFLNEALASDGRSTQRMVALIKAMQDVALTQCQQNKPLCLSNIQLSQAIPDIDSVQNFEHTHLFPNKLSVSDLNLIQWQTYAAQLERENERLSGLVIQAHHAYESMQSNAFMRTFLATHRFVSEKILRRTDAMSMPEDVVHPIEVELGPDLVPVDSSVDPRDAGESK